LQPGSDPEKGAVTIAILRALIIWKDKTKGIKDWSRSFGLLIANALLIARDVMMDLDSEEVNL
jgi:hypothetical protein